MSESNKAKNLAPYSQIKGTFGTYFEDELEIRLMGNRYLTEFKKMADSDSMCGAFLLAISNIFRSIEWKADNDPKGVLRDSLDNVGWSNKIDEIISFLIFGHSLFEVPLEEMEDGRVLWKDMLVRPQDTIYEWSRDSAGRVTSVRQMALGGKIADINISKCLYFGIGTTTNRPQGKSIFRNAYRDWYYRSNIERIESIGVERDLTGIPVLKPGANDEVHDENGQLTAVGKWAWQLVRNVKRNEQEGIVIPNDWTFDLQGSPGKRQFDLNAVITRYDAKIALSILSQFLVLGIVNSSGSFALSKSQSDLYYRAIEGFANLICHTVNSQFIGSKAVSIFNNVERPKLVALGINKLNLGDLAGFLGRVLKFNVIQPDDEFEKHLRRVASLPEKDESSTRYAQVGLAEELELQEEEQEDEGSDNKNKEDDQ